MKPTFTNLLKTLMLGGALSLAAGSPSKAASMATPQTKSSVDDRVAKIREALESQNGDLFKTGNGQGEGAADVMWWRNVWGNGGWHNWHNGWHNWHNGGWGNWHNW